MAATRHLSAAAPLTMLHFWLLFYMSLSALHQSCVVEAVAVDDASPAGPPYDLDSIVNQLAYPNPVYQLHVSALRNQLRNILRERQLNADAAAFAAAAAAADANDGNDQYAPSSSNTQSLDYDYSDGGEDKRSVAALAAQGWLHPPKRGLATLAKNGQLPSSPEPDDDATDLIEQPNNEYKRYVGALARSGGLLSYGKRNIGTLARDYQLPQNGKRNVATLARLGLLTTKADDGKRNMAAVARYNSHGKQATIAPSEKRNIGALKASPVHGGLQHKRDAEDEVYLPASLFRNNLDYVDYMPNYYWYPSYADLDWGDFGRAQKRFLDTSKDPERFGIENVPPSNDSDYEPIDPGEPDDNTCDAENENANTDTNMNLLTNANSAGHATLAEGSNDFDHHQQLFPQQQKRHIGAVYRSGFLPSYRSLRSTIGSYGGYGGSGGGGYGGGNGLRGYVGYGGVNFGGGGRFSRSGRARQFVEYFRQHERLHQPIAAVCKRCYLPYRPVVHWGGAAGIRRRLANKYHKYYKAYTDSDNVNSIITNSLPITFHQRPPIAYASTTGSSNSNSWYSNGKNKKYYNSKNAYRAQLRSASPSSPSSSAKSASAAAANFNALGRQKHHWGTPPRITAMHRRSFRRPDKDFIGKNAK